MKPFTGTINLLLFILKRDKISLLCWILILPLLPVLSVKALAELYPDTNGLQAFMQFVASDKLQVSMLGEVLAPNLGAGMSWKWTAQSAIFMGIFNLFLVIKHTRTEEATGRYDLLSSGVIGRYAILTATLLVALLANFLIGASVALYLVGYGLPAAGSWATGLSAWWVGNLFAAFSAVAAQLTSEAGSAKGLVGSALGLSYIVRMMGHSGMKTLGWCSPMYWVYQVRPFADENWAILGLFVATTAILTLISYALLSKRDIGSGFLQLKDSIKTTSPYLSNALALAWRLHRKMIFWWTFAVFSMGALCGAMMDTITLQMTENNQLKQFLLKMGNASMGDLLFTLLIALFIQSLVVYSIMAMSKMQEEEMEHRTDLLFSVAVSRFQWTWNHFLMVFLGLMVMLIAFGGGAGLFYGMYQHETWHQTQRMLEASFAFLPALALCVAFSFFVFAIAPKHFYLSWALLIFIVLLDFIRPLFPDIEILGKLSPFAHVPQVLLGEHNSQGLIGLSLISIGLAVLGFVFYRKRDMV